MKKIFLTIVLLLISAGCVPPPSPSPLPPSPPPTENPAREDEQLFNSGLNSWKTGDSFPKAFQELTNRFPDSPFSAAAGVLFECKRNSRELEEENAKLAEKIRVLEEEKAQINRRHEQLKKENMVLRDKVKELEANLEKFKLILLETEQRSP